MLFRICSLVLIASLVVEVAACGGPIQSPTERPPSREGAQAEEPLASNARQPALVPRGTTAAGANKKAEAFESPTFPFELGTYVQSHVAFFQCEEVDPCQGEVQDTLTVLGAADGVLNVAIEVTQDNGHRCNFEGLLAEIAPDYWGWADETQQCRVELRHADASLTFTSDGCREVYCGARARLQGTFALSGLQNEAP